MTDFPSLYDFFYADYAPLQKILDVAQVSSYFQANGFSFSEYCRGYLYFTELSLIHIINHLEGFISDSGIDEFVMWGNQNISNKKLKELCKSDKTLEYIFTLSEFRKQLSAIRFKENISESDIVELSNITKKLGGVLGEIDSFIIKKFDVKRKTQDRKLESMFVLNSVMNKYNYIDHQIDFFPDDSDGKRDMEPLWPGSPFFYLMPSETKKNYCLSYGAIKKKDFEYLMGYKLTLAAIYEHLEPAFGQMKGDLLGQNNWFALHKSLNKIHEKLIGKYDFFKRIFDMSEVKADYSRFETGPISNSAQLDSIFRGREVRVIAERSDGDYPNTQNLFMHLLFGAITLFNMKKINKPEIIEFKQVYENGNWIEYTYAIYSAVGGSIWDSSHWNVFDKLTAESDFERVSDFRRIYLDPLKKAYASDLNFSTIIVNGDVLKKYLEDKDIHLSIEKSTNEKLHEAKGLITEFLSFLYLSKISDVRLLDIRKSIPLTDIDVLAEDSKSIFIVQAKQEIPKTDKDFNLICSNFANATKHLGNTEKSIKRLLFVMRKMRMATATIIDSQQVVIDPRKIESDFKSKNIDVVYFQDLKKMINDSEHQDLLNNLTLIFSVFKTRRFKEL